MQKSRLGESGIDGKLSLEGKMGPFLILSLVVGGQLGAKRAKLTPLRGLRGTKLELKGALGSPKESPRQPKRGRSISNPQTALRADLAGRGRGGETTEESPPRHDGRRHGVKSQACRN